MAMCIENSGRSRRPSNVPDSQEIGPSESIGLSKTDMGAGSGGSSGRRRDVCVHGRMGKRGCEGEWLY